MELLQITYVSASSFPRERSRQLMDELIVDSVLRNKKHGITGTLVFTGKHFAQFIEGERDNALRLMNNIQIDSRHEDCTVVRQVAVDQRIAHDWLLRYSGPSTFIFDVVARAFEKRKTDNERQMALLHQLIFELTMPGG